MTKTNLILVTPVLALLSACGIGQQQLSDFGKTADKTVQVVGTASTVTANLISQNEVTRNACRYLQGGNYTLAAAPQTTLSPLLSDQRAVVAALGAYADAIAGALDAKAQSELDAAGGALATSLGSLGQQFDTSAQTAPSLSLLLNAIVQIEENHRISAVKREMEKVLPFLNRLKALLEQDQQRALAEMDHQIAAWEEHSRCVLSASRHRANAEETFRAADKAKRALLANRKQAERAVLAMDALIDSHFQIVYGDADFEEGLKTLNVFLADLQAIKDA